MDRLVKKLLIKDVRCFAGRQELNIRPITFLVGENSTGKSTALGCFHVLHKFLFDGDRLDFNCEPYQMGTFVDVARRSRPAGDSFQMGFEFQFEEAPAKILLTLEKAEKTSVAVVREWRISVENDEFVMKMMKAGAKQDGPRTRFVEPSFLAQEENGRRFVCFVRSPERPESSRPHVVDVQNLLRRYILFPCHRLADPSDARMPEKDRAWFTALKASPLFRPLEHLAFRDFRGIYSFAPIRSKSQRTYDPLQVDAGSPDGSDMPMVLMSMAQTAEKKWEGLKKRLTEFGKTSGLFKEVGVRRFARGTHYPFQLQIKVKGPKVNLVDVGYGVGQLLPILVRVITAPEPRQFLLQQPEVHLHPRAQAELSSFLIDSAKEAGHDFIIETHSDYMVDRARIAIRKKEIKPEDVSLIYFAPHTQKSQVRVHNIEFDAQGNTLKPPKAYRDFFLKEFDDLLGFES